MSDPETIIVGGGLAGLSCAQRLNEAGKSTQILEASDQVGGRARTDKVDGFLLDRGFQVLLTAYPAAKRLLDYEKLDLRRFEPGALVRYQGKFHRFADPWRRPRHFLATALSPIATIGDKLRVARLKRRVCHGSLEQLYQLPETTTDARLRDEGFSNRIIEHFFRPFLGGVFLEAELQTSSRMFDFVFRMFAEGEAALPAQGMGQMARQVSDTLPAETIKTNARVKNIVKNLVKLESGEALTAENIVVASDAPAAARMLGDRSLTNWHQVTCVYFAADQPPIEEPILVLNGEKAGPINNLCVPSQVAQSYAPNGQSLVSVSVLGIHNSGADGSMLNRVVQQLVEWFGDGVKDWRHLKTYEIPLALPDQSPPALTPVSKPSKREEGIYLCGDYLDTASIQGAIVSGQRAADCILNQ